MARIMNELDEFAEKMFDTLLGGGDIKAAAVKEAKVVAEKTASDLVGGSLSAFKAFAVLASESGALLRTPAFRCFCPL